MTIRTKYAFTASPAIEYVTADRMNKTGFGFGANRLIGMSTPGVDVTEVSGGVSIDYPQSDSIRVCLVGNRLTDSLDPGECYINVRTRAETGGPSVDHGDYWTATSRTTKTPLHEDPPTSWNGLKDPWTWLECGRVDNKWDTNGFQLDFGVGQPGASYVEELFWVQLSLLNFVGPSYGDSSVTDSGINRDGCSPGHQKLWLNFAPNADMEYIRNVLVYEWPRHPDTPTHNYVKDLGAGPEYSAIHYKSVASAGRGSEYDIFTGK